MFAGINKLGVCLWGRYIVERVRLWGRCIRMSWKGGQIIILFNGQR